MDSGDGGGVEGGGGRGGGGGIGDFFSKLMAVFTSGGHHHNSNVSSITLGGRKLDFYQISRRVNRSFFAYGDGLRPFNSLHFVHIILVLGLLVGLLFLFCACYCHTMQKLKSWCPSIKLRKKRGKGNDVEDPVKEMPTPEEIEQRRQERLQKLQQECEYLEQQITDERSTMLTSRASDSDLEYLGYGEESPPLKRNSISLQDIPQSVIRIRREKQLRQLKEEIEHLHALSQSQDLNEIHYSKSPLLKDIQFDFPSKLSKSSSSSPVDISLVEPLSTHISHLKAHRKLKEIRADLEGLAVHLIHADELRAKTSSLQDLPRTALGAKRQENLLSISKEIEHLKNYKLQQKCIITSVLPQSNNKEQKKQDKNEILAKLNKEVGSGKSLKKSSSPSKSPLLKRQESEMSETQSEVSLAPSASLKRTRAHELNRVRVELKELSYKLSLNYNNIDDDREKEKIFPSDWPRKFSRENSFNK